MPDHLHLLASPLESGKPITQLVGGISSKITRFSYQYDYSGKLFQRSFYDHIVRKDDDLRKIAEYILNNPVRKELVRNREEYPYCGFLDPLPV